MRGSFLVAAVTAAATLTGSALAGGAPAGVAAPGTRAAPGAQLWTARFQAGGYAVATAVAVSPAGSRVFVTGGSNGRTTGADYATVAYSAATGSRLWASRYNGPRER